MKRHLNYIHFIMATLVTLSSCEETIEFRGERSEPKIVMYSLLQPDSLISVSISKSHAVFDYRYAPQQITNATVRLYGNDELLETLTYVVPEGTSGFPPSLLYSKYVTATTKPLQGVTYRIEAEVAGLKKATGEASLLSAVAIESVDTATMVGEGGTIYLKTSVRFSDPPNEDNYYMISLRRTDGYYYGDHSQPHDPESPVYVSDIDFSFAVREDPLITPVREEDLFGMYIENTFNVFSDELIAGKNYEFNLKLNYKMPDTTHYEFLHYYIDLQSISKEMYLYLKSYSAHMQTRDAFMSEPVLVYTNVENGAGVVGVRQSSHRTVGIGRYPVDGVLYANQNQYWK
jgi:hypothetical protein